MQKDAIQGGFVFGAQASTTFSFTPTLTIKIKSKIITKILAVLKFDIKLLVDLLNLIILVIVKVLQEKGFNSDNFKKAANINPLRTTWGLLDTQANQFAANKGSFSIEPFFALPISLVPFIEDLEEFDKALQKLHGNFRFGPSVGIGIPLTADIKEIQFGKGSPASEITNYAVDAATIDSDGNVVANSKTNTDLVNGIPTSVGVTFQHQPSFGITVGQFADVILAKLFHIGVSRSVDVSTGLKIGKGGPFTDALISDVGSGPTPPSASADTIEAAEIEEGEVVVILDPA